LAILDPKKSKELQLDELVYKIKRYCEIYNIEFMKSEQKKLLKRRKKYGKQSNKAGGHSRHIRVGRSSHLDIGKGG